MSPITLQYAVMHVHTNHLLNSCLALTILVLENVASIVSQWVRSSSAKSIDLSQKT